MSVQILVLFVKQLAFLRDVDNHIFGTEILQVAACNVERVHHRFNLLIDKCDGVGHHIVFLVQSVADVHFGQFVQVVADLVGHKACCGQNQNGAFLVRLLNGHTVAVLVNQRAVAVDGDVVLAWILVVESFRVANQHFKFKIIVFECVTEINHRVNLAWFVIDCILTSQTIFLVR